MLWFNCPFFSKKFGDDVAKFQVNHLVCFSCDYVCPIKTVLIDKFLYELKDTAKFEERAKRATAYNCPLNLRKECSAHRTYCSYNPVCPNIHRAKSIKMLRYRRVNMFIMTFKDKTTRVITKKEKDDILESGGASSIVKALKVECQLEITTELLPNTAEGMAKKDDIDNFVEKFGQNVVLPSGKNLKLKEWYNSSKDGDSCYVADVELVPVKKIRVIPVKNIVLSKSAAITPVSKKEQSVKPAETPKKQRGKKSGKVAPVVNPEIRHAVQQLGSSEKKTRVRRTRAQLIAAGYYDESGKRKK